MWYLDSWVEGRKIRMRELAEDLKWRRTLAAGREVVVERRKSRAVMDLADWCGHVLMSRWALVGS